GQRAKMAANRTRSQIRSARQDGTLFPQSESADTTSERSLLRALGEAQVCRLFASAELDQFLHRAGHHQQDLCLRLDCLLHERELLSLPRIRSLFATVEIIERLQAGRSQGGESLGDRHYLLDHR